MLRSMYSAISGMQVFQTKLDVIGNNIANVNTTGFKAARTDFADVLSQTMSGSSAPVQAVGAPNKYTFGGVNSQQVGLGVKVAGIQTMFTQGAAQSTGNPTDLMLNGDGLFIVSDDNGQSLNYTRQGNFSLDAQSNLVLPNGQVAFGFSALTNQKTAAGTYITGLNAYTTANTSDLKQINLTNLVADYSKYYNNAAGTPPNPTDSTDPNQSVMTNAFSGWAADPNWGNVKSYGFVLDKAPNVQIGADGAITANVTVSALDNTGKVVNDSSGNPMTVDVRLTLGHLAIASVANPAGLDKAGDSLYTISKNSGQPTFMTPGQSSTGTIQAGYLEMSNVDLTREFTEMIVAQRGFDANSKMIGTDNAILQDIVNLKNA